MRRCVVWIHPFYLHERPLSLLMLNQIKSIAEYGSLFFPKATKSNHSFPCYQFWRKEGHISKDQIANIHATSPPRRTGCISRRHLPESRSLYCTAAAGQPLNTASPPCPRDSSSAPQRCRGKRQQLDILGDNTSSLQLLLELTEAMHTCTVVRNGSKAR
jgi:hypothetical protein